MFVGCVATLLLLWRRRWAEAAYIGGLTAVGLHSEQAVAAVLLFRLATFWLPVLPGWAAMLWLQRSDAI